MMAGVGQHKAGWGGKWACEWAERKRARGKCRTEFCARSHSDSLSSF